MAKYSVIKSVPHGAMSDTKVLETPYLDEAMSCAKSFKHVDMYIVEETVRNVGMFEVHDKQIIWRSWL